MNSDLGHKMTILAPWPQQKKPSALPRNKNKWRLDIFTSISFLKETEGIMDSSVNRFKRPMNALQKQWYRILIARKVGFATQNEATKQEDDSYQTKCLKRYRKAFHSYNQQFRKEIEKIEAMQPSAIDAMRVHRTFAITTLWPPLHSKREINLTLEQLENVLSVKERRRLRHILKNGIGANLTWVALCLAVCYLV